MVMGNDDNFKWGMQWPIVISQGTYINKKTFNVKQEAQSYIEMTCTSLLYRHFYKEIWGTSTLKILICSSIINLWHFIFFFKACLIFSLRRENGHVTSQCRSFM